MKLLELHIENFGVHRDCLLELSAGFQPIFGENESGKSTLLELVRQLFYNFSHVNRYAFDDHRGGMAATALVQLDDNRQLRFRRRKGKGNTLSGSFLETGDELDQSTFDKLLSGTSVEMYKHLFGFSLHELSSAQEGLAQANLQQVIFGSGLGSLERLTNLQRQLRDTSEKLYSASGRATKPEINGHLRRIQELVGDLRAACVRPHEYKQLKQQRDTLAVETQQLAERRTELRRKQSRLQRLIKALPSWCQLRDLDRQLAELALPDSLPTNLAERHSQLSDRRRELAQQLQEISNDRLRAESEYESLVAPTTVLAQESVIRRLQQQLGHVESLQQELPDLQRRAEQQQQYVAALLDHLDPAWSREDLHGFHTTLADRTELESHVTWAEKEARQRERIVEQLRHVDEELARCAAQLSELGAAVDVTPLQRLLHEQAGFHSNQQLCAEIDDKRMRLEQRIHSVRQSLNGPMQTNVVRPEKLSVPMLETVEIFRQRFASSREKRSRFEQALESAEAVLEEKVRELEHVGAEMSAPDRDALKRQRRRRDQGWEIVRRIYVSGQDASEEAMQWLGSREVSLPEVFEREMHRADEMADQRQDQAALVARQEQLEREVQLLRSRVVTERKKFDGCLQECRQLDDDWLRIWMPSHIAPLSPEEMKHWLKTFQEYVSLCDEEVVLGRRRRDLQDLLDDFIEELVEHLGEIESDSNERLRVAAAAVEQARCDDAKRNACREQLNRLTQQQTGYLRDLEQLDQQQAKGRVAWQQWLRDVGFPDHWGIATATKVVDAVHQAGVAARDAEQLRGRVLEASRQLDAFDESVRTLTRDCDITQSDLPATSVLYQLIAQVEEGQRITQERRSKEQTLQQLRSQQERLQQQMQQLELQTAELWKQANVTSPEELERLVELQRQYQAWSQERHTLTVELAAHQGNEEAIPFHADLNRADQDTCALELHDLEQQVRVADESFERSHQQLGAAQAELDQLDGESRSLALAAELESRRSELARAVDRWAPIVIAEHLLAQNMDRFERQFQPELLNVAERFLGRMTGGRYTTVRRRVGGDGTPEIFDASQELWKGPEQLSRGTCEQLYLSIRLAYILHHCRDSESLPVVMDDVLVNFDATRARQTLDVLREVADSVQILFLTCHASTLELIREAAPEVSPVHLPASASSSTTTALDIATHGS